MMALGLRAAISTWTAATAIDCAAGHRRHHGPRGQAHPRRVLQGRRTGHPRTTARIWTRSSPTSLKKETITGQEMMAILEGRDPATGGQLRRHPGEAQQGTAGRRPGAARPQRAHDQRAAGESLFRFRPSEDAQDENQTPDAEEDAPASGNVDPDAAPQDDTTPDSEQ